MGTLSPSSSPVQYPDLNCNYYEGTTLYVVEKWSEADLSTYTAGSRVRIHNRIYKCKKWPFNLWCKMAAYEPEQNSLHLNDAWVKVSTYKPDGGAHWSDAWERAGTCPTDNPTTYPSVSPNGKSLIILWSGFNICMNTRLCIELTIRTLDI